MSKSIRGKGKQGGEKPQRPVNGGSAAKARERSARAINPKVSVIANDPLRADIAATALQRPYSPSEFAKDADIGLSTAAYHFRVLKEKGVIELTDEVQVRGATKHMYRTVETAFIDEREWGELTQLLRPGIIGATVDNFNARFAEAAETGTLFERADICAYWAPREFDEVAWEEHVKVTRWWIEESERLACETADRNANGDDGGPSFGVTIAIFAFPSPPQSVTKRSRRKRSGKGDGSSSKKAKGASKRKPGKRET